MHTPNRKITIRLIAALAILGPNPLFAQDELTLEFLNASLTTFAVRLDAI